MAEERITYSISTPFQSELGQSYLVAKRMQLTVVSVIRSDLKTLNTIVEEAVASLGDKGRRDLEEAARLLSHTVIPRTEGINPDTRDEVIRFMASTGNSQMVKFVRDLSTAALAGLLGRARMLAAFPEGVPTTC